MKPIQETKKSKTIMEEYPTCAYCNNAIFTDPSIYKGKQMHGGCKSMKEREEGVE